MPYRLLSRFESLFDGKFYNHRSSTLGDAVALELFEDLLALDPKSRYAERVATHVHVLNRRNTLRGKPGRRGDGTFGQLVPNAQTLVEPGYAVARGETASISIGTETKIVAKAMLKQIDRVIGDLNKQIGHFSRGGVAPISFAAVGLNFAERYSSIEGDRMFTTDGKKYQHPAQEAFEAERRLLAQAAPKFDEFLLLRFRATNESPFKFAWVNAMETEAEYGAALVRILDRYHERTR